MSSAAEQRSQRTQTEVRRLMDVARTLARLLGVSNRELERRAGLHHTTMVRNFSGQGEPKLEFLFDLIQALGMEFHEFFELAYAGEKSRPTEAALRVQRLLEHLRPGAQGAVSVPEPQPEPRHFLPREDREILFEEIRREVRKLMDEHAHTPAPAVEKGRRAS